MSTITTHILDTSAGMPAADVHVTLHHLTAKGDWEKIAEGDTDGDGRIKGLVPSDRQIVTGRYRLNFETGPYFKKKGIDAFYPFVEVVFEIRDARHHHVPLLLNPFGYSTYRGS